MSNSEILQYKNSLINQRYDYGDSQIIRISRDEKVLDQYVQKFEGVIDPFIIDQSKILESKAIRRLSDKTQVIYIPGSPHIRNRSSHTSEVSSTAKNMSDILGLNTNLVEAISLGHDIGHAPSGHLFERVTKDDFGVEFKHEVFSAIISVFIERHGMGLNLTRPTIDGILSHSQDSKEVPANHITNESKLVMYSDKIAYLFADINDLVRIGKLSENDLAEIDSIFPVDTTYGNNQRTRVSTCIDALVKESAKKGTISFEDSEVAHNFKKLKKYMYGQYKTLDSKLLKETVRSVIDEVSNIPDYDPILITSLMTDLELKNIYEQIISSKRINLDSLTELGVGEIIRDGILDGQSYNNLQQKLRQKLN